jgi:hypothetical protein
VTVNIIDVGQQLERHKMLQTVNRVVSLAQNKDVDHLCEDTTQHLHDRNDQRHIGLREFLGLASQISDHVDTLLDFTNQLHV